jgi:CheY-like chemotaxis protein
MKPVLVVDDDPAVLKSVGFVLKHHGCPVTLAPNGPDCLTAVRNGFRGIVLMDIMMPGLTGWATIRALVQEQLQDGLLICMLTAKTAPDDESQGLEPYVFDYLPKPFDNVELMRLVESMSRFLES